MYWACTNLMNFPEPGKPVWEQDPVVLEALMLVEEELRKSAEKEKKKE